jgi:hypothetical protein
VYERNRPLCPVFVSAQSSKKKITNAADLPRLSYDVPEKINRFADK